MIKKISAILALALTAIFCYQQNNDKRFFLDAPIIFDLAGNGVDLVDLKDSKAFFDINSDGKKEKVSWFLSKPKISRKSLSYDEKNDVSGVLVIDKNSDGIIDNVSEFFGKKDKRKTSREELLEYDLNQDGVLNKEDQIFSQLQIWLDLNGDGASSKSELVAAKTLISEINCKNGFNINRKKNDSIIRQEGYAGLVGSLKNIQALTSVEFAIDASAIPPKPSKYFAEFADTPFVLMDFIGLGSLIKAMDEDEELYNQIKEFKRLDLSQYRNVDNMVETLLHRWSKASLKLPNGSDLEKRLATLEVMLGHKIAPEIVDKYWNVYLTTFREKILSQITFSDSIFLGANYSAIMYGRSSFGSISYEEFMSRISNFSAKTQDQDAAKYFSEIFRDIALYNTGWNVQK